MGCPEAKKLSLGQFWNLHYRIGDQHLAERNKTAVFHIIPGPKSIVLSHSHFVSSLLVFVLVALYPSNMLVYLRDGSAQTIAHAATQR